MESGPEFRAGQKAIDLTARRRRCVPSLASYIGPSGAGGEFAQVVTVDAGQPNRIDVSPFMGPSGAGGEFAQVLTHGTGTGGGIDVTPFGARTGMGGEV